MLNKIKLIHLHYPMFYSLLSEVFFQQEFFFIHNYLNKLYEIEEEDEFN
jgi:hypothetical protein